MIEIVNPNLVYVDKNPDGTEAHEYRYNGQRVPNITTILAEGGVETRWFPDDGGRAFQRGRYAHKMALYFDQGRLDWKTVDPLLKGYLDGWIKFRLETGFDPLFAEGILYHPWGFAGTPDRFGKSGSEFWLPEMKTGGIGESVDIQTAGQELLLRAQPEIKALVPDDTPIKRLGVQLPGDGTWKPHWCEDDNDRDVFLGALAVVKWKIEKGGMRWK